MLSYSGLSKGFWGEAILTAGHNLKRVSTKANNTPLYKYCTKKKTNLTYIRIWGCKAIVRLSGNKRSNIGERGLEQIFVGYVEFSKTYK